MVEMKQLVDGNRVYCAVRAAEQDVEHCYVCRRLKDVRIEQGHCVVICRGESLIERDIRTAYLL
jgi:hypothetical protein